MAENLMEDDTHMVNHLEEALQSILKNENTSINWVNCKQKSADREVPRISVLMNNVCYIVCAVLINENNEVLLIQEAKPSCKGTWYLPAGRMEPNETILEAVKREMKEEAGLEFEPSTLLCVETQGASWFRFTFTGSVTGGKLKTTNEADAESLQARWVCLDKLTKDGCTPLRNRDIIGLIDRANIHRSSKATHADLLPIINPHQTGMLKILLLHQTQNRDMHVLVSKGHLPVTVTNHADILIYPYSLIQEIFTDGNCRTPKLIGVLSLEHCGKPKHAYDGLCLTLLLITRNSGEVLPQISSAYGWQRIKDSALTEDLCHRMNPGMTVQLIQL